MEIKPSNRARKLQENKLKKQKQKAVLKRQRDDEQRWHMEMRSDACPQFVTSIFPELFPCLSKSN